MSTVEIALLGVVGGLIPEVIRLIASLRNNETPTALQMVASALTALLGLGVLLFSQDDASALQIAVQGAAFPSLFSGLVAVAVPSSDDRGAADVWNYIAWRQ